MLRATVAAYSKSELSLPYAPVQDGYFHDIPSSESVRRGRIATVPMIIGETSRYTSNVR